MATTGIRVPGGGNTYLIMGDSHSRIELLANFTDSPGKALGRTTAIHPIGYKYPKEIATPYVQDYGTLTIVVWAEWGTDGWVSALRSTGVFNGFDSYMGGKQGEPVDVCEVLRAQRQYGNELNVIKVELGRDGKAVRGRSYHGCVITDIDAKEDITLDKMEQKVTITMQYCKSSIVTQNISSDKMYVDD